MFFTFNAIDNKIVISGRMGYVMTILKTEIKIQIKIRIYSNCRISNFGIRQSANPDVSHPLMLIYAIVIEIFIPVRFFKRKFRITRF